VKRKATSWRTISEFVTSPAQSQTPGMLGNFMRENREAPVAPLVSGGRLVKAMNHTTNMNATGESDECIVPTKCSNKEDTGDEDDFYGEQGGKAFGQEELAARIARTGHRAGLSVSPKIAAMRGGSVAPLLLKVGAVCAKVRPYGSVRGAGSNPCSYRD